jgi:hypothetical protein
MTSTPNGKATLSMIVPTSHIIDKQHQINKNWNGLLIDLLDMIWSHISLEEQLETITLVCHRWNNGNKHGFGWGHSLLDIQQLTDKHHHSMWFALLYRRLHHIESLTIPGSLLAGDIRVATNQLSRLQMLTICDLDVATIDALSLLPSLTNLNVQYQSRGCTNERWQAIHTLPYLRSLSITGTHWCTDPLTLGASITQLTFGLRSLGDCYIIMDHTWKQLRSLELHDRWFHNCNSKLSFGGTTTTEGGGRGSGDVSVVLLSSLTSLRFGHVGLEKGEDYSICIGMLLANCVPRHLKSLIVDGPTIGMIRTITTFGIKPVELNLNQTMSWSKFDTSGSNDDAGDDDDDGDDNGDDDNDNNTAMQTRSRRATDQDLNQKLAMARSLLLFIPLTYDHTHNDNKYGDDSNHGHTSSSQRDGGGSSAGALTKLSLHLYQFSKHLAILLPLLCRMSFLSLHDCDQPTLNWLISHLTPSLPTSTLSTPPPPSSSSSSTTVSLPLLNGCYIGAVHMETGERSHLTTRVNQTFSRHEMINGDMMTTITKRFHLLPTKKLEDDDAEGLNYKSTDDTSFPQSPNVDWRCMISPTRMNNTNTDEATHNKNGNGRKKICYHNNESNGHQHAYNVEILHVLFHFFDHSIVESKLERVCRTWLHASTINGCGWKTCGNPSTYHTKPLIWTKLLSTTRLSRVRRIILHSSNWLSGFFASLSSINYYLPRVAHLDISNTSLTAPRLAPLVDCKHLTGLRIDASFPDRIIQEEKKTNDDEKNQSMSDTKVDNKVWVWHDLPPQLRSLSLKCGNQHRIPHLPFQFTWAQLLSLELSGWWQSTSLDNDLYRSMSLTQVHHDHTHFLFVHERERCSLSDCRFAGRDGCCIHVCRL